MGFRTLLDAYCGVGGASAGYAEAGFDIVGVDHRPQPHYPYDFIQADAIAYIAHNGRHYDAIHASPPCQDACFITQGNRSRGVEDLHEDLIPVTRELLRYVGRPWVLENVPGAKMRADVVLCGEMFGLDVIRHRLFELGGWTMPQPPHPPHQDKDYLQVYGRGGGKGRVEQWREAMGMPWAQTRSEIREAIPPDYTAFLGAALMAYLNAKVSNLRFETSVPVGNNPP